MKVVCQTCCGVDVHKSFLVATIIKTTSGIEPSYHKKRFSTNRESCGTVFRRQKLPPGVLIQYGSFSFVLVC
jgi:hypothetical protein